MATIPQHYTSAKAVLQAISNQAGPGHIVMLKSINTPQMEAIARQKAESLNLRLAVMHQVPAWPDVVRFLFYSHGLESQGAAVE